jgi:hypothetical protein
MALANRYRPVYIHVGNVTVGRWVHLRSLPRTGIYLKSTICWSCEYSGVAIRIAI